MLAPRHAPSQEAAFVSPDVHAPKRNVRREFNGSYGTMRMKTLFAAILAMAVAVAFAPIQSQAASFKSSSQVQTNDLSQTVAKKKAKKKAAKKKAGKKVAKAKKKRHGPGSCGVGMYWKKGKCNAK
jgi:hypothetical protein